MRDRLFALLVHQNPETFDLLRQALRALSIETYSVPTCAEANSLLTQTEPHLVFTDTRLSDGTWVEIVNMIERAYVPINVIVVGSTTNTKLYLSALERGAYDLVVPPFEATALARLVQAAGQDVRNRRLAWARETAA